MSTRRYVYNIYNTTADKRLITELDLPLSDEMYPDFAANASTFKDGYTSTIGKDRLGNPVLYYSPVSIGGIHPTPIYQNRGFNGKIASYPRIIISRTAPNPIDGGKYVLESYLLEPAPLSGSHWHAGNSATEWKFYTNNYYGVASPGKPEDRLEFYVTGGKLEEGPTLLATVSSSTRLEAGAFDDNGTYKWRYFKGSDTIDPEAVSYSKVELYPGDTIEIRISPHIPTYGGTIYYQYQYTFDGKTWINLGNKTTSITASFTIPEDVEHFQARVLASDGWGFTSASYISGPSMSVSQMKAYGTVSGITMKLAKGWCIVGKTVRSLEKCYVTTNGVWEKLF